MNIENTNNKLNDDFIIQEEKNLSEIFSHTGLLVEPKISKKIIIENIEEQFIATPLAPGLGTTIGNALRRTLLGEMGGYAIAAVKITGATHKFQNINGILENVSDILMNLKEVVIKVNKDDNLPSFYGTIEVEGPGDVYAKDLNIEYGEIVNPNHYICSLDVKGHFKARVLIVYGRGYVEAEDQYFQNTTADEDQFLETALIMDCSFNHIINAEYFVEHTRVNQKNNYDKLILTIKTTGAVTPEEALGSAYQVFLACIKPFNDCKNFEVELTKKVQETVEENIPPYMFYPINKIGLSDRVQNTLRLNNIKYVGDLVIKTESELNRLSRMGHESIQDIKNSLAEAYLSLGMVIKGWDVLRKKQEEQEIDHKDFEEITDKDFEDDIIEDKKTKTKINKQTEEQIQEGQEG